MSIIKFSQICDICGKKGPEYDGSFVDHCDECEQDVCKECMYEECVEDQFQVFTHNVEFDK